MENTPRESTRAKWLLLHQEFEGLNLTVREFCAERKVNIYTFKDWQKRFRKEGGKVSALGSSVGLFRELSAVTGQGHYAMTLRGDTARGHCEGTLRGDTARGSSINS